MSFFGNFGMRFVEILVECMQIFEDFGDVQVKHWKQYVMVICTEYMECLVMSGLSGGKTMTLDGFSRIQ